MSAVSSADVVSTDVLVTPTNKPLNITFTNANSADVPTLNVNSTGAKAIYNEAGVLLTKGYSMLVFVDKNTGKPMLPPHYVTDKLKDL